jgi:hypothetical protein
MLKVNVRWFESMEKIHGKIIRKGGSHYESDVDLLYV